MRETEFGNQTLQSARLFERIEVLALNVLNQRHRDRGFIRNAPDDRRDLAQPGLLRGAPAPLTGDDLVALYAALISLADGSHHDRLHDALRPDRIGEFGERL